MNSKLIAIFGASGAGKSTLSNDIYQFYGDSEACIISQDDYYFGINDCQIKNFDEPNSIDFELLENHIEKLIRGINVESPVYNFSTHKREENRKKIESKKIIILDGTLLLNSKIIENLSSYIIYCDVDLDVCFIRRLRRDLAERGRLIDSIIIQYLEEVKPSYFKYIKIHKDKANFFYNETNKIELLAKIDHLLGYQLKAGQKEELATVI